MLFCLLVFWRKFVLPPFFTLNEKSCVVLSINVILFKAGFFEKDSEYV